jgi:colanic acid biosynthesis glycosyl transferase WcaI
MVKPASALLTGYWVPRSSPGEARPALSTPMDILFFADNFPPEKNAAASRVYERACYWVRWGHRVTVIASAPNFPEGKLYPGYKNRWYHVEENSGIRVVRVKTFIAANTGTVTRVIDFLSYMLAAFLAGLFQKRPSVVVATSPQFFAAVAGWALSRVKAVPFVFELSDLWPDSIVAVGAMKKSRVLKWVEKLELFLYRQSAAVVALTAAFKRNLIQRGIADSKITVVTNGVDLGKFQPRSKDLALAEEWGITPEQFVVSYIGTHGMAHGLQNVLACAQIVDRQDIRFVFVGAGAEREKLLAESETRGLRNVTFVPSQPKEKMPGFWSITDVALVHLKNTPVFATVIPSKIFEAMGMGLPVLLVCPKGEASHIIEREGNGICVDAEDPQALAHAITLLHNNRAMLARFGQNSRAAAPRYSRERQAREMLTVLESVAIGRRAAEETVPRPAAIAVTRTESANK